MRHARLTFTIPQNDHIPGGLAVDPKQHFFYMGSLSRKKIIKIGAAGVASDFFISGRYDPRSICGIQVHPQNEGVWANTCPDSGKGAELLHFDINFKLLERSSQSTAHPHLFNDLVLRNSDEIYLTDSLVHQALRFDGKTHAFAALPLSRPLYYPNGIASSGDGASLYVVDAFGVLQYDLRRQKGREVQAGASNTISGFDGLSLASRQSCRDPEQPGPAPGCAVPTLFRQLPCYRNTVLEYRSDCVELPTTGTIDGSDFNFHE